LDVAHIAKLDVARHERTGIPEVILAEGKQDEHLAQVVRSFVAASGRALVSRLAPERLALLDGLAERRWSAEARLLALGPPVPRTGGRVLVYAAGTADVAVAEEARLVAEELGCETRRAYDVGVAGIHRLYPQLDHVEWSDVIIVAAGREGALATVVAGLVDRPVIGLPVSVGYGMGGRGEAALLSMLQACSPLLCVNIDAGTVAGACAAQIANRVARARNSPSESRERQETLTTAPRRE
jgi:NCAIR mutase (PurE)-related protein